MARYLCQLCNTIVHDGEDHPCFIYRNEDEVYVVPQPDESEEMERSDEKSVRATTGNSSANNGNACQAAQNNDVQERNETNSVLTKFNLRISPIPSSRRKRSHSSLLPSVCRLRAKKRRLDKKSASSSHMERILKKSATKIYSKIASASARVLETGGSSSSEASTHSLPSGSISDAAAVSVAGPSGIRTHTRRDGKEKPHVCDVCGRAFAKRQHLQQHNRTHTGDKPFVCGECGKGFTQQAHLTRHLRTHTGEKPFECEFCDKMFAQKIDLDRHLQGHTGEKPHKCEFCDKEFADKRTCTKHQKREHGGME